LTYWKAILIRQVVCRKTDDLSRSVLQETD